MPKLFNNIILELDDSLEEKLAILAPNFTSYRITKKSVDARNRQAPRWVVSCEVYQSEEVPPFYDEEIKKVPVSDSLLPVTVVGSGPAGLFAALRLVERGIPCQIFEQGSQAAKRMRSIANYWRHGILDKKNNVCFGEGGAGLYSDGKLITRIRSPYIPYVLDRLVSFGAPKEITYLANPHVGSDRIRRVIPKIREHLISKGCKFFFDTRVEKLLFQRASVTGVVLEDGTEISSSSVILATGHSNSEIFYHLKENDVALEGKSFAIGLRIEHPQAEINSIQYREYATHPDLGAATYRLTDHDSSQGIGVYSFCMCPGGYVISSGTEDSGVVTNGMSNYARNSPFANAAIVVSIDHQKRFQNDLLAGLKFRKELETKAKSLVIGSGGTKQVPTQKVSDYFDRRLGELLRSSCPSGVVAARLDKLLPEDISNTLIKGLERFDKKMHGFLSPNAQLHGIETRTSCPVRIPRDPESLQSISHANLYPAGEGAGYAGGITSAAVDGVKVAEAIAKTFGRQ